MPTPIGRRSIRALLFDIDNRLLLIRRTKPDQPPYWTTPGGGVEPDDPSHEATPHRELIEELGARIIVGPQVFLASQRRGDAINVQHLHVCRVLSVDPALRCGPEYTDPT
ncbi:MAG TPA: NUDIX hydrolase [Pseudonocardiaceae bacterium]|nr:NUDIX hydrolase [Pseudonocardiaceae bacterium]